MRLLYTAISSASSANVRPRAPLAWPGRRVSVVKAPTAVSTLAERVPSLVQWHVTLAWSPPKAEPRTVRQPDDTHSFAAASQYVHLGSNGHW